MELKKSHRADLEGKRTTLFLLGLVVVLSSLLVALEYTSGRQADMPKQELDDDLHDELEMMAAQDMHDMMPAAPAQPASPMTQKLKPVETHRPVPDRLIPTDNPEPANGEGGADTKAESHEEEAPPPLAVNQSDEPLSFRVVQQLPEFPGGIVEFMKWITRNLQYPMAARQRKIEGKVVVSFIINKDGSIADVRIVKSADPMLDREAMRVIRMMPKWKPGIENNKPCRTMFAIPVNFKL